MSEPDETFVKSRKIVRRVGWGVLGLAVVLMLADVATDPNAQWDFRTYYYAVLAQSQGFDPYSRADLSQLGSVVGPYRYPPLTLHVFSPLTLFPLRAAAWLWLALKLGALAGLLVIWHRSFVSIEPGLFHALFLVLAFNSALPRDIVAGNISVFEQLVLWLGFSFLLRGRVWPFCACVLLVSQFRLWPVAFLGLLFLMPSRPRWKEALVSGGFFAAMLAANAWAYPGHWQSFWMQTERSTQETLFGASSLQSIRYGADFFRRHGVPVAPVLEGLLYVLVVAGVMLAGWWAWGRCRTRAASPDIRLAVLFSCVCLAILLPRMQDYMYLLLFAPTLYILRSGTWKVAAPVIAVMVLLPPADLGYVPVVRAFAGLFHAFLPLWIGYALFVLYLLELAAPLPRAASQEPIPDSARSRGF